MKIRKLVAALAMAGAVVPTTQAALQLGTWTVNDGSIDGTTTCIDDAGTCSVSTLASGDGFLQQEITVTVGSTITTYIRTIVADPNDTSFTNTGGASVSPDNLNYSDESIVMSGGTNSGILSKQTQGDASSGFSGSSELHMGWAGDASGNNKVIIDQSFTDYGTLVDSTLPPSASNDKYTGDTFQNGFSLTTVTDSAGNKVGKSMSIDQVLEMGNYQSNNDSDVQRFVVEERQGTEVPSAGTNVLTLDVLNADGTTTATPVDWSAGDDIMVAWLGQQVNIADPGASTTDLSLFGFERVTNLTTSDEASTSSTTSTDVTSPPFAWDATNAPFGDAPTLPAIGSIPYP